MSSSTWELYFSFINVNATIFMLKTPLSLYITLTYYEIYSKWLCSTLKLKCWNVQFYILSVLNVGWLSHTKWISFWYYWFHMNLHLIWMLNLIQCYNIEVYFSSKMYLLSCWNVEILKSWFVKNVFNHY